MARLQQQMAAEVSEAAQQVQLLLAAQARVAALEAEAAEARRQAEESEVGHVWWWCGQQEGRAGCC